MTPARRYAGLVPAGGTISFRSCEKKWQKKSRAKGDTPLCPPSQTPRLRKDFGSAFARWRRRLLGTALEETAAGPPLCRRLAASAAQPRLQSAAASLPANAGAPFARQRKIKNPSGIPKGRSPLAVLSPISVRTEMGPPEGIQVQTSPRPGRGAKKQPPCREAAS